MNFYAIWRLQQRLSNNMYDGINKQLYNLETKPFISASTLSSLTYQYDIIVYHLQGWQWSLIRLGQFLFWHIGSPFELIVFTGSPHKSQVNLFPPLTLQPFERVPLLSSARLVPPFLSSSSSSSLVTMRGSTVGCSHLLSSNLSALQLYVDLQPDPQQGLLVTHFLSSLFISVLNTLVAQCPLPRWGICMHFQSTQSHREQKQNSKFIPLIFDFNIQRHKM